MNLRYFFSTLATLALTFCPGTVVAGSQMETAKQQRTLIILKPDAMERKLAGVILSRFEDEGFAIVGAKVVRLDDETLRQHYAHISTKPFFGSVISYMEESPVLIVVLEGNNAIARVRDMVGPTDSSLAPKGTIRGDFGKDKSRNAIHASEDEAAADVEISRFFGDGELFFSHGSM
jgi:nucleoside-diphosphate kinase